MSESFENVHYVVIPRRSAHKREELEAVFQGRPQFRVIIDRRQGERRKSVAVMGSDNRSGVDRRK